MQQRSRSLSQLSLSKLRLRGFGMAFLLVDDVKVIYTACRGRDEYRKRLKESGDRLLVLGIFVNEIETPALASVRLESLDPICETSEGNRGPSALGCGHFTSSRTPTQTSAAEARRGGRRIQAAGIWP